MKESTKNILKFSAEVLITPGSSLLSEGKFKEGAIHVGLGILGMGLLGLPGIVLVGASSFQRSNKKNDINLVGTDADCRIKNLNVKVAAEIEAGMTLEEIKAGIEEDVEDAFQEVQQSSKAKEGNKK